MPKITRRNLSKVVGVLALVFLLLQIPPLLLETNPPVVAEPKWDSAQTRALAQRACFDCHSNQTEWPWYSRIAPASYLVVFDVIRGRGKLNFSEWGAAARAGGGEGREGRNSLRELDDQVKSGSMPPWYFLLTHAGAKLSDAEKAQLIQGLKASP